MCANTCWTCWAQRAYFKFFLSLILHTYWLLHRVIDLKEWVHRVWVDESRHSHIFVWFSRQHTHPLFIRSSLVLRDVYLFSKYRYGFCILYALHVHIYTTKCSVFMIDSILIAGCRCVCVILTRQHLQFAPQYPCNSTFFTGHVIDLMMQFRF